MRRNTRVLVVFLALLGGACGSRAQPGAELGPLVRGATTTPPSAAAPSTPLPPTAPGPAPPPTLGAGLPPTPPAPKAPPPPATPPGVVISPHGVVLPVVARTSSGWTVRTPCGSTTAISEGTFVPKATVVLDPGHGGPESGAVSPAGLTEATVNLGVAERARDALQRSGIGVAMTRTDAYNVSLGMRAEIAAALGPRAFVSIHHNASPDSARDVPGTETYYQYASPESKRLSGLIYEEVFAALAAYRVDWVGDHDAGAKYRLNNRGGDYYAMLRLPPVTSVLAELAFISNPPEADLVGRPDVQTVEGDAVARGILRFLNTADGGSGFVTPSAHVEIADGPPTPIPCQDPPL